MDIFGSVDANPLNRSDRYDISQEVNPQRIQFAINILAWYDKQSSNQNTDFIKANRIPLLKHSHATYCFQKLE